MAEPVKNKDTRYTNGKIYSIRSYLTDKIYIGSTCHPLSKRLAAHRSNYKRFKLGKGNAISSFKILDFPDCYIELIELCPCGSKMELQRREGEIMRECANKVNIRIEGRTDAEYYIDNRAKNLAYGKIHGKISHNCICGSYYTNKGKSRHLNTISHLEYVKDNNITNFTIDDVYDF